MQRELTLPTGEESRDAPQSRQFERSKCNLRTKISNPRRKNAFWGMNMVWLFLSHLQRIRTDWKKMLQMTSTDTLL